MRQLATKGTTSAIRLGRKASGKAGESVRDRVVGPIRSRVGEVTANGVGRSRRGDSGSRRRLLIAAVAGAAGSYFLDPDSGKRRRHMARDRVGAFFRRRAADAERQARYTQGVVKGAVHEATHPEPGRDPGQLNDPALEAKVESELFRDADAPKDKVVLDVQEGVVHLRGELDSSEQIEALARRVSEIPGVRGVENLLHLPGQAPPSKQDRGAGERVGSNSG